MTSPNPRLESEFAGIKVPGISIFKRIEPYLYLVPSFILIITFVYIPILIALVVSLFINPSIPELSDEFGKYYTNFDNMNFIGLGTMVQDMVDVGFYPVFHVLLITFGTIAGHVLIRKTRPELNKGIIFFISLAVNLIFSTLLLNTLINLITSTGQTIRVPLRNYDEIFWSELIIGDFLRILLNTFLWSLICTFFHVTLGIFLAVMVNGEFRGTKFFRTVFILPWAIPSFITALIWRNFIFDNDQGILGRPAKKAVDEGKLTEIVFTYFDLFVLIGVVVFVFWGLLTAGDLQGRGKLRRYLMVVASIVAALVIWRLNTGLIPPLNLGPLRIGLGDPFVRIFDASPNFYYASNFAIMGYETKTIFLAAILTNIWLGVPFMMLSFLATLQSIPGDLYEAAEIDGASAMSKFRSVTFPNLIPTLRTVALLGMIWTFNLFNVFYILSQNQTGLGKRHFYDIFITYIYNLFTQGLRGRPEYAAASALSFVVFIILVSFSKVYQAIFPEEED